MTLTELRYVIAVAREKHFGRAARTCFVSQSTLSLGIKKIEEELGVVLFERNQKDVLITPAGREIVERAEKVTAEIARIKETGKRYQDPHTTRVSVGAISTVAPYLFPSLLPVMHERNPGIRLLIEENVTSVLMDRLHQGVLDLAILSLPVDDPTIETIPLYLEPLVALVPTSHPLCLRDSVVADDLTGETLLLMGPAHCLRGQVMNFLSGQGVVRENEDFFDHVIEGGSLETMRYMVASGVGIAIVPATAACAEKFSQRLVCVRRFTAGQAYRTVAIAFRRNHTRAETLAAIIDAIHRCELSSLSAVPAAVGRTQPPCEIVQEEIERYATAMIQD